MGPQMPPRVVPDYSCEGVNTALALNQLAQVFVNDEWRLGVLYHAPRFIMFNEGPGPVSTVLIVTDPRAAASHRASTQTLDEFEYPLVARGTVRAVATRGILPDEEWEY